MANNNNKQEPQLNTAANHHESRQNRTARCCCCLFSLIWYLLISIIILVLLIILVLYIILQPRSFTFHVNQANLTTFNYLNNTTMLRYNLVLNFTIHNPNKKLAIYFDEARGHALYQEKEFAAATPLTAPWFSYLLYTKERVSMSVVFSGNKLVVLDVDDFEGDMKKGIFGIDVKIYFLIRFRIGNVIGNNLINNAMAKCGIKVPFNSSTKNGTIVLFEPTKCEVDF
ncbi:yls9-like [Stylosanthes scabra]|uniref:Yls9-like n=1 Tax=Stylosanthes scabra TaxID=79078 RepID=A0ABU6ZSJ9_9FABA|nr:yls9-like [Stylosanthes scabra]